jgi:hypothetical protein
MIIIGISIAASKRREKGRSPGDMRNTVCGVFLQIQGTPRSFLLDKRGIAPYKGYGYLRLCGVTPNTELTKDLSLQYREEAGISCPKSM